MAKRLTEQERKDRDAVRAAEAAENARSHWRGKMASTLALKASAGAQWDEAFAGKKLTLRDLWLLLAVFETEEKMHLSGKHESCKTKWFDRIAPHARKGAFGLRHGLSGFTTRTATKASQFLKQSHNGYIWVTDLGYALVQELRARHPELAAGTVENYAQPLEVAGLGEIPPPRWKVWKDWDEKVAA
jgi:hypothetical protein